MGSCPGARGLSWMMAAASLLLSAVGAMAGPNESLVEAARHADSKAVSALLRQHVDANTALPDGTTALHWAAQLDDLKTAALLTGAGARAGVTNDYGATPLAVAASNGSAAMIALLLKAGANPNAALPSGETALMSASRSGKPDAVKALLKAGADVNAREHQHGQTALMWAAAERHADVARVLLEGGADIQAKSMGGFTTLLFAARMGDRDLVSLCLDRGLNVNAASDDGTTPLLAATVRGHVALAEWLLDHGADPNLDPAGYTALHWASGTFDTMSTHEYQMEQGEWSALAGIPRRDAKLGLIKTLLAHGASVDARMKRNPPRFGYTLGGGSIVGGGSYVGGTPFFLASTVGDMEVMRLLLAHGADPKMPTADGTTPLMATAGISIIEAETSSSEGKLLEALKFTMELGNDINAVNDSGNTALHAIAFVGFNEIARFLIDHGIDKDARNYRGETALTIAIGIPMSGMFYSQPKTAELLRKLGASE